VSVHAGHAHKRRTAESWLTAKLLMLTAEHTAPRNSGR
jgi:hypothetical protein